MKTYLHLFETQQSMNNYLENNYEEPYVACLSAQTEPMYDLKELAIPLTFEVVSGGTLYWRGFGNVSKTIEYKKNDGEWSSVTSSLDNDGSGTTICSVVQGDIVQFRGDNNNYGVNLNGNGAYAHFWSDAKFYGYGNIVSLLTSTKFITTKTWSSNVGYVFAKTFYQLSGLLSHPTKLLHLPLTSISGYDALAFMFADCTSLERPPEMPVTTDGANYRYFFAGCTSLKTAPSFLEKATVLKQAAYNSMFENCVSLEEPPKILPATTTTTGCYLNMFKGCIKIKRTPELPAKIIANSNYESMFEGCTSLTKVSMSLGDIEEVGGYRPCYRMFAGCWSLKSLPFKSFSPRITVASAMQGMFMDCTGLTTAPELLSTGVTQQCYQNMFTGCISLRKGPSILPAMTLANGCYQYMFEGCPNLEIAPELPATTLAQYCYYRMFINSNKVRYIKCLATDISATNCVNGWMHGVSPTGVFEKAASMTSWPSGEHGIPNGWTVVDINE